MPYSIDTPFILIIFGASGDLAKLKLFPALYELMHQKRLPTQFYIIGFARTKKSLQKFRQEFKDSILKAHNSQAENETLQTLLNHVHYLEGQYNERSSFLILQRHIKKLTKNKKYCMIHYFAVPPSVYQDIIENLGETRTNKEEDMRLVIEKPFGEDTKSAEDLFHFAMNYFKEDEI
ncbi:hypothetical protein HY605_05615, partial [Candidatus Peregrinibacteria bacterium]|nr:hypothetical protein [Candidatus Peregrinibacteria bacterium]